jgi:hypothetical protein
VIVVVIVVEKQFNTEALDTDFNFDTDFDFDFDTDSKSTHSKGNTNWTSIPFSAKPNAIALGQPYSNSHFGLSQPIWPIGCVAVIGWLGFGCQVSVAVRMELTPET